MKFPKYRNSHLNNLKYFLFIPKLQLTKQYLNVIKRFNMLSFHWSCACSVLLLIVFCLHNLIQERRNLKHGWYWCFWNWHFLLRNILIGRCYFFWLNTWQYTANIGLSLSFIFARKICQTVLRKNQQSILHHTRFSIFSWYGYFSSSGSEQTLLEMTNLIISVFSFALSCSLSVSENWL